MGIIASGTTAALPADGFQAREYMSGAANQKPPFLNPGGLGLSQVAYNQHSLTIFSNNNPDYAHFAS